MKVRGKKSNKPTSQQGWGGFVAIRSFALYLCSAVDTPFYPHENFSAKKSFDKANDTCTPHAFSHAVGFLWLATPIFMS